MESGTRLGPYEIQEQLGAGGMGEVYLAYDTTLDRAVAVKVLPAELTADGERRERFEREAKAVAALTHPNIVAIYGFGDHEGVAYAAMELLEGQSLREVIDEGPVQLSRALDIAGQVIAGLAAAHARGIVHRDLKPENLFVGPDGRVRILDFGLAASGEPPSAVSSDESSVRTRLTDPGVVVGSVAYMAPEQMRGAETQPTADIFALGVVLHEMLTGTHPFVRDSYADTLGAVLRDEAPTLTDIVGPTLNRVIGRCMAKSPEERFESVRDLAFSLDIASNAPEAIPDAPDAAGTESRPVWGVAATVAVTAALTFFATRSLLPESGTASIPRIAEITFSGADYQPDVSPADDLIAFTSNRAGVSRIWLKQMDGTGERPLTEGSDWRPRFNGDGSRVAFIRRVGDSYSAFEVPVIGGEARKIIDDVQAVVWAPDGTRLAFLRGSEQIASTIGIYDPESGTESILAEFPGWGDLFGLDWSPDSKRLLTGRASIQRGTALKPFVILDPDTGDMEEIEIAAGSLVSGASWLGNDALVYALSETLVSNSPQPARVVHRDLRTHEETTLFWEPYLFPSGGSFTEGIRINVLSGGRMLFETERQIQTITEANLESGASQVLTESIAVDRQPSYSSDGTQIAFMSTRTGNPEIFRFDRGVGRQWPVTENIAGDWDVGFAPEGERVVWSSDRGGEFRIWIANIDGTRARAVSERTDSQNPTMTADGQWIVYASGDTEAPGIYRIRPDGSDESLLVPGALSNPDVSRNGQHVLFIALDAAALRNEIRVARVDTGEVLDFRIAIDYIPDITNLLYGRGRWMADDSGIAFVGVDENDQPGLFVQDFVPGTDTSTTKRRLLSADPGTMIESFDVAPDGLHVAVSQVQTVRTLKLADHVLIPE
jgi:serine/threonine protein kinase